MEINDNEQRVTVGIDPGHTSGGICTIAGNDVWWTKAPREVGSDTADVISGVDNAIDEWLWNNRAHSRVDLIHWFVEKVGGRFGDGASRAFNFGYGIGSLNQAVYGVAGRMPVQVTPREWQQYVGVFSPKVDNKKLKGTDKKNYHKEVATQILKTSYGIDKKLTHWQTDSFLIAHWGHTK
jgi:hypothetical protein